jgi:uncharacterized protein YcbK (DUF882 family)
VSSDPYDAPEKRLVFTLIVRGLREAHRRAVQLTQHFRDTEFMCECGCTAPDAIRLRWFEVAAALEKARVIVGRPITIISGYRCKKRNAAVGGAPESEHIEGTAVDIAVQGWPGERLRGVFETLIALDEIPDGGLGTYVDRPATLHYDLGKVRRW